MNNATTFTYDASAANRSAYAGQLLLTKNHTASTDSWETGLNNNVLVLGCSGGGKTRNHLKPNLMQCQGSYVVLDTTGSLYYEMGPYLRSHGYKVDLLDFTRDGEGSVGYDPLSYIRWSWGHPCTQDIITVASAICSTDEMDSDPFWARAAANYLASYIAYVLEALPEKERNMASVVRVFEQAGRGQESELFEDLEHDCPESYAVSLFYRAKVTARAERMHSSIMGIIAANILADVLVPLTPVIVNQMKKGAYYITSGILDVKEEVVKEAVNAAGLTLVEVTRQGEWVCVTARKD